MELGQKVWIIENIPVAHASTNANHLLFTADELSKSYQSLDGVPIVINKTGVEESDHAINSSMNTVGWVKNPRFDGYTVFVDGEVTDPDIGPKVERRTTTGRREIGGVSMGARMDKICSICGGNIEEAGHEHQRGIEYDGKIANAIANNTKFDHLALTSNFADKESTLDKSKIYSMEIASKIDINQLKVTRKEVATMPMAEGYPSTPPASSTPAVEGQEVDMSKQILAALQRIEAKLGKGASETADVAEGNAMTSDQKTAFDRSKQGLQPEQTSGMNTQTMIGEDPKKVAPTFEGSAEDMKKKEEDDEEKKVLKEVASRYKHHIALEIASKTGLDHKVLANRSIKELEAMKEVASKIEPHKSKVDEFATTYENGNTERVSGMEAANKRIGQFGIAGALKNAYEMSIKGA
jgi:hypothetical protein